MIIYGASGHGKVVQDIAEAMGQDVTCFVDQNAALHAVHGIPVVQAVPEGDEPLLIAIGDNATRKRIAHTLHAPFATAVHPAALVSPRAEIAEGSVVMAGAIIQSDAIIGRHCIVNTGASVDHECRLGDYVHISPHATLCGNVSVGEGTWVGAGAVVIQGIRLGRWAVVGAGAVVTADVPDFSVIVGNRPRKLIRGYYKRFFTEEGQPDTEAQETSKD